MVVLDRAAVKDSKLKAVKMRCLLIVQRLVVIFVHSLWDGAWLMSIKFILRFAFCVFCFALFSARPHDSSNLQIWAPVTK